MAYIKKQLTPIKVKYESSTPATPESGFGIFYFDNATQLPKFKNAAGTNDFLGNPTFPLLASDGLQSAPAYAFSNDTSTGIYRSAAQVMSFSVNNTHMMKMNTTDVIFKPDATSGNFYIGSGSMAGLSRGAGTNHLRVNGERIELRDGNSIGTLLNIDQTNLDIYAALQFQPDNTLDCGRNTAPAMQRPRHLYVGTSLQVGTSGAASASEIANFTATAKGVVFPNITSVPAAPVAGMVVFDTNNSTGAGTNKLVVYDGTTWIALH